ncbi:hypothetical protein [Albidovulum sp.]
MRKPVVALACAALVLSGCATIRESRLNPFNWFGKSREQAVTVAPATPEDGRQLVAEVIALDVSRNPGGAIVTATGLPPRQGYWSAELVPENGGEPVDGVLTYRFLVAEPIGETRISTPRSREVTAARFISNARLEGVRQIVVLGLKNSRVSRR